MKHADWLEPTKPKAAIGALCLAAQCMILVLMENPNKPVVAVLTGVVVASPVVVAVWSPVSALALSSVVTVAVPALVDSGSNLIFAFIVVLIIYTCGDSTKAITSLALGVVVLSITEILTELLEERNESASSGFAVDDWWFVIPAVLEAAVIAVLVVGLGTVLATTRRQAATMLALERANGEMALEAERHRIARDLHDVAAHHLSSIVVRMSTARKLGDADEVTDAVSFAGDRAAEALTAMRQIVTLLRSSQGVNQSGLAALDQIVSEYADSGLNVSLDCDDAIIGRLGSSQDLALSRVVRESLANVGQHSEATEAMVAVAKLADGGTDIVCLTVTDPGPAASRSSDGMGLGLIGMRERVEPLGGSLNSGPNSGGGWTVEAQLPLGPSSIELESP